MEKSDDAVALPAAKLDPQEVDIGTNWPGFRGINASGISAAKNLPVEFDSADAFAWRAVVVGQGNSSPVVWDEHVLLTSAAVDSDGSETALVLSYDRQSGSLRWQAKVPLSAGATHAKNGYASGSVATNGKHIYAFFGSAGLHCFDFDGKHVWHANLGTLEHKWGTASSPALWGDLVIQLCDAAEGSFLAAYDAATGELRWKTERSSFGTWSTPVFLTATTEDGTKRTEVVVNGTGSDAVGGGQVVAYDPASGEQLWNVQGTTDIVCPTALVAGGIVYSMSGRNGPIMAIRPGGSGDVTKTHLIWKARRGGPYVPTGIVYRNRLFVITDGGVFACYNAGNGDPVWRTRLGGNFTASLVAGDGKIYAVSERGTVHVLAAADEYQPLAESELGESCLATPAIANSQLFIRTQQHLFAFAADNDDASSVVAERQSPASARRQMPRKSRQVQLLLTPRSSASVENATVVSEAAASPSDVNLSVVNASATDSLDGSESDPLEAPEPDAVD